MELIKVELTSGEMHDILRAIYSEKEDYKQELKELESTIYDEGNAKISDSIDATKCRIDDLECLENKLMKARGKWLTKPMRDAESIEDKKLGFLTEDELNTYSKDLDSAQEKQIEKSNLRHIASEIIQSQNLYNEVSIQLGCTIEKLRDLLQGYGCFTNEQARKLCEILDINPLSVCFRWED